MSFYLLPLLLLIASSVSALEMSKSDFCLTESEAQYFPLPKGVTINGKPHHPALVATVGKLMKEFEIKGPMILHFTDYVGPKKVWSMKLSDGKHIYFAKNAVDLLLGAELTKIASEVCRPEWTGRKTFTVNYTNTVMEQFLRHTAERETMERILSKHTGWTLRGRTGDKYFEDEQNFRTEELVTLAKQLLDIPPEVFKKMRLKKVTRWRYGGNLPIPLASAMYIEAEQKIILSDKALMNDITEMYGEGTILHEMGHAYWFGVSQSQRDRYSEISWHKIGGEWKRKVDQGEGFISGYAMKSPEEDFAEHFAGYIHRPEYMDKLASRKKRFFEDNIFTDTSYFTTVAKNAKVKVDSDNPDTKAPWLEGTLKQSLKVSTDDRFASDIIDINVEINNAFDDISGVAKTYIAFTHTKNEKFKVFVDLNPRKNFDGSYTLKGRTSTDPKKLASGLYKPDYLGLEDNAGNVQKYRDDDLPRIHIKGDRSSANDPNKSIDVSRIKFDPAPIVDGHRGYKVTLPVPYSDDLDSIYLDWDFVNLEEKTTSVCNLKVIRHTKCLIHQEAGKPIEVLVYFHKEYPSSQVQLAHMKVSFMGSEKRQAVPVSTPNTTFFYSSEAKKLNLVDLEVNQMKLTVEKWKNREGGDQNIVITVPLINDDAGIYSIFANISSPTGQRISGHMFSKFKGGEYRVTEENGQKILHFRVPLKMNPEDGVYILESLKVETIYRTGAGYRYLPFDNNNISYKNIKLLERGIRKTITIHDGKMVNQE